ncbi:MAG TPA: TonB-dependent receptor, partial [Longimicrobiales bacterium]
VHSLAGTSRALVVGLALLAGATGVSAQEDVGSRAYAALQTCVAAAEREDEDAAEPAADEADRLYRELAQQPGRAADALTGQARVRSQCRIPFVGFMSKGALVDESNDLLERALRVDPRHFGARFTLGMNHFYTPSFLGRTGLAIEAFETLLEQYGGASPLDPRMRVVYLLLGDLYEREDRDADARRIWTMGARLFPDEGGFAERLERLRAAAGASAPALASGGSGASTDGRAAPSGTEATESTETPVFDLDPLVVEAGGYSMDDPRASTAITRMEVYTTPGGTADILQVFQTMPGVTRATEGSDLYVRGGEPAEAPVWVDGARMPYAGTFEGLHGGLFGVLDPSVLERAYFSSGGFSARYGDALSGVLDLETEGRPSARSYRVGLNLVSLGAAYRAPIGEKAGAWAAVSGTETTALLAMQGDRDEYPTSPRALQGVVSFIYQPAESIELRTTTLREGDETSALAQALGWDGAMTATGETWLNTTSARWRDQATGSSVAATASVAGRRTGFEFGVLDWVREDRTVSLRVDGDRLLGASMRVRAGVEGAFLDADQRGTLPTSEELRPGSPSRSAAHDTATHHAAGYVEAELRPLRDLGLTAGLRADRLPGEDAITVDPRAAVVYRLGDSWSVRAGTGIFHQGRWRTRLSLPDAGEAAGVARRAVHFAAGAQRDGDLAIRAELFMKRYDRYAHDDDGDAPRAIEGSARGLDLLASWDAGRALNGWVSYSLLDGEIELEDGTTTSSRVDVTHTLTAVVKYAFADMWEIGGTGRYATGRPFTPIVGQTTDAETGTPRPVFGELYAERLPEYFRLDARLTRVVGLGGGFAAFYLEALNVLGRSNVMDYTYDAAYEERREIASFFGEPTLVFGVEAQF